MFSGRISLIAAVASVVLSSAAGAVTCPIGGTGVEMSIATSGVTCGPSGNGNLITGNNDVINKLAPGYLTLDTTATLGVVPLTITGLNTATGGFSFTPSASYDNYIIGFQTTDSNPKPDYFSFFLPAGVVSGTWAILNGVLAHPSATTTLTLAVLYGELVNTTTTTVTATPLPGAVFLFGTVLAGGFGVKKWRSRVKRRGLKGDRLIAA